MVVFDRHPEQVLVHISTPYPPDYDPEVEANERGDHESEDDG